MRRHIKKTVGLVVGGLVVVCSLVSYGFGVLTEQAWHTQMPLIARAWDLPVSTTRYTRGWFSSTAETFLVLSPAAAALCAAYVSHTPTAVGTRQGLTVVHRILHGPFPVGPRLGRIISLVPVPAMIISSLAPDVAPRDGVAAALPTIQVSTTIFFHGASKSHVVVPAFASRVVRVDGPN